VEEVRTFQPPARGIMRHVPREQLPKDAAWDAQNVVHVSNRIRKVPGYSQVGATLASRVQRLAVQFLLNGDVVSWALTQTRIYEDVSGTWTNRTHGAGDYTSGARWILDQVSNADTLLATNNKEQVQKLAPGGAAVDLAGAPPFTKCYGVRQFRDFMLYWGTTEGGDFKETRIRWSDLGLFEIYSGGLAGFNDLPGSDEILEIEPLSDDVALIYRVRSLWRMRFVGSPSVFFFEEVASKGYQTSAAGYGTASPFGVSIFAGFHEYVSPEALYRVAGDTPVEYGELGRLLLYTDLDQNKRDAMLVQLDQINAQKYIFYPGTGASDFPNKCLIEDYKEIHGPERAYWKRTDISPTGVGFWITSSLETWTSASVAWNVLTGTWTTAAQLPDQPVLAWGDNSGKVYRFGLDIPDGAGAAIACQYESGLYLVADEFREENPRSRFRQHGRSVCVGVAIEFESRGSQALNVDVSAVDGVGDSIVWTPFTIGLTDDPGKRFYPWVVGRYFAYRVRTSGVGAAPLFGDVTMWFVPDAEEF